MRKSLKRGGRAKKPLATNIAIVTGVLLVPFVVAAGFLADRIDAPATAPPAQMTGLWPELRGTFDGEAVAAAPAHSLEPSTDPR